MHPPVMVAGLALACLVGHSLAFDVPVVAPTNSTPWPSHCQPAMDAWCNSESLNSDCINAMRNKNATLPLYARFDTDEGHGTPERRCYSGTSLTPDHSHYEKGTSYCTRDAQLAQVQAECVSNITLVDVFTPGELGYPCIRIPSIILIEDTLLAFAECRNFTGDGCYPHGALGAKGSTREVEGNANRDLCMKTSTDAGNTWGPLSVIARNGAQPSPVWDTVRSRLIMQYTQLSPGDNMQSFSNDLGKTWSKPQSIARFLSPGTVPTDVGPGVGIQLSKSNKYAGRLLFIGHHGAYEFDSVWYSDDGGLTYTQSNTSSMLKMDEAQLVELPDGSVMANMRNSHLTSCKCRATATSHDGGATFGPLRFDPVLVSPVCMGSVLRSDNDIYFANPASTAGRVNGTVRRSSDAGATWAGTLNIWPGAYAYSCLSLVPDTSKLGLLFETSMDQGCTGASCRSVFVAFDKKLVA
eukprot:m.78442 g.78442  ORF g.78442 m.78442 type:complete len:467 (-) comp14586_c0_seq2:288-1688(-)